MENCIIEVVVKVQGICGVLDTFTEVQPIGFSDPLNWKYGRKNSPKRLKDFELVY